MAWQTCGQTPEEYLTTTPTARAPDTQTELDHLTGDAGGSEGEASGLDRYHGAFPKKLFEILNFTISVINNFGSEVSRIRGVLLEFPDTVANVILVLSDIGLLSLPSVRGERLWQCGCRGQVAPRWRSQPFQRSARLRMKTTRPICRLVQSGICGSSNAASTEG